MMKYLILLSALIVGCGILDVDDDDLRDVNAPDIPENITERNAEFKLTHPLPGSYLSLVNQWWRAIEECTGITMNIKKKPLHIHYINADNVTYTDSNGDTKKAAGVIWVDHQYTRVILNDLRWEHGYVTSHEMMHYILWLDGQDRSHSNPMFKKCKHLMLGTTIQ